MHGVIPLSDVAVFLRQRVLTAPPRPVSLPGKKRDKRKAWNGLSEEDRRVMVPRIMEILEAGTSSKFQYEGACRNGLRSGFCLEGMSWGRADTRAAAIVTEALRLVGGTRPTWQEAQLDYADDRLERWHCKNCGRPAAMGENGRPRRYCSDECLGAFHGRMNARYGHRQSRAAYLAACAAQRQLRTDGQRDCDRCGKLFKPTWRFATYCVDCRNIVKREKVLIHEDRPCAVCGSLFRPRKLESKYCSKRCEAGGKRERPASAECSTCHRMFIPNAVGQKFCCHACFTTGRRVERAKATCPTCLAIFQPRNATNPNKFCSRICASRSRFECLPVE